MRRWIELASEWLKPIHREIKDQMMRGPYIQVDETPISYLDPAMEGRARVTCGWRIDQVRMSSLNGTPAARRNAWRNSYRSTLAARSSVTATAVTIALLEIVQRKADRFYWLDAGPTHDGAFMRRLITHQNRPAGILIQIGRLYDIERTLRRQRAGQALRDAYRTSQSIPICRRLKRHCRVVYHPAVPAKEHDGQSGQLRPVTMGVAGSLPQKTRN